jgi:hypothetical protein
LTAYKPRTVDVFEEVKNNVSILEVVRYYSGEKPNRADFICCPFHGEKTPSLKLYPKSNSFYCFGCGAGGDVIRFVRLKLGLKDGLETVKTINRDFNLRLPVYEKGEKLTKEQYQARKMEQEQRERELKTRQRAEQEVKAFEEYIKEIFDTLADFLKLPPTAVNEPVTDDTAKIKAVYLGLIPQVEYMWEVLFECTYTSPDTQKQVDFCNNFKSTLGKIKIILNEKEKRDLNK